MTTIDNLISELEHIAENPREAVADYVGKTGSKAVGVAPVYTPEELVHAAGMLPVGIWGGQNVTLDLAKQYFPAFCNSVVFTCMELALKGTYNQLSAAIIPGMDDTLICLGQNWKAAIKDIPFITLVYPQNRKLSAGVKYLVSELENVKKELEKVCGKEISEEAIFNSIDIYNEHRQTMREFVELAATHPNSINNVQRSHIIKSAYFMLKEEHTQKVKLINDELKKLPEEKYDGHKIITTGFILDSKEILEIMESNALRIVGDDIAHETRQFRTDVPRKENALLSIATQWSEIEGCSFAYDPFRIRGKMVAKLAKDRDAEGVVFALLKFCDTEEYDAPILLDDIHDAGLKAVTIEIDQESGSIEQIRTRLQTFAEML